MESVETTLRRMKPQPAASASTVAFNKWRDAVLERIDDIEANRGVNHPIGIRLKNFTTFMTQQLALMATPHGKTVKLKAGEFFWLLVRLKQRQEGMKAKLEPDDSLARLLDPKLRREIDRGWEIVKWPRGFQRKESELRKTMTSGRAKDRRERYAGR